jgi:hypothetical protein
MLVLIAVSTTAASAALFSILLYSILSGVNRLLLEAEKIRYELEGARKEARTRGRSTDG